MYVVKIMCNYVVMFVKCFCIMVMKLCNVGFIFFFFYVISKVMEGIFLVMG